MQQLILSGRDVMAALSPQAAIAAVRKAALRSEVVTLPERLSLTEGNSSLLVMPAGDENVFVVKSVTLADPAASGPAAPLQGVVSLFDALTGAPLALIDGAMLTAQRTAAISALAIDEMTPPNCTSLTVIGAGAQGRWQAAYACAVRPIERIHVIGSPERRPAFEACLHDHAPDVEIIFEQEPARAVAHADIVIAATAARDPILPNDMGLIEGRHFVAVGSYQPDAQELPNAVAKAAGHIVIDCDNARRKTGDVLKPLAAGCVEADDIITLGALLLGEKQLALGRTSFFKSVGMALYDLHVALAVYQEARRRGLGTYLDF